jgi:hypothetical protein
VQQVDDQLLHQVALGAHLHFALREPRVQGDALALEVLLELVGSDNNKLVHVARRALEADRAGFHLREIEDVLDQRHQAVALLLDHDEEFLHDAAIDGFGVLEQCLANA